MSIHAASRVLSTAVLLLQRAVKRGKCIQTGWQLGNTNESSPSPFCKIYREVIAASQSVRLQQQWPTHHPLSSLLHHACICMGQFVCSSTAGTQLLGVYYNSPDSTSGLPVKPC
jgi:hypothetical protein